MHRPIQAWDQYERRFRSYCFLNSFSWLLKMPLARLPVFGRDYYSFRLNKVFTGEKFTGIKFAGKRQWQLCGSFAIQRLAIGSKPEDREGDYGFESRTVSIESEIRFSIRFQCSSQERSRFIIIPLDSPITAR